jgi:hypothetical protein
VSVAAAIPAALFIPISLYPDAVVDVAIAAGRSGFGHVVFGLHQFIDT